MDTLFTHLSPLKRRFPHPFPVHLVGRVSHSNWNRVVRSKCLDVSFILAGRGRICKQKHEYELKAPCVFLKWPNEAVEMHADDWTELLLQYAEETIPALKAARLVTRGKDVWQIKNTSLVQRKIEELRILLEQVELDGRADEIDRACESLILESILSEERTVQDPHQQAIQSIQNHVQEHFLEELDFGQLARQHGLSPGTFRRHWAKYVQTPPSAYVMELRLRRACRLLVETQNTVGEIAFSLKFEDRLYFSRKFRKEIGYTPTEYRAKFQTTLVFDERGK